MTIQVPMIIHLSIWSHTCVDAIRPRPACHHNERLTQGRPPRHVYRKSIESNIQKKRSSRLQITKYNLGHQPDRPPRAMLGGYAPQIPVPDGPPASLVFAFEGSGMFSSRPRIRLEGSGDVLFSTMDLFGSQPGCLVFDHEHREKL